MELLHHLLRRLPRPSPAFPRQRLPGSGRVAAQRLVRRAAAGSPRSGRVAAQRPGVSLIRGPVSAAKIITPNKGNSVAFVFGVSFWHLPAVLNPGCGGKPPKTGQYRNYVAFCFSGGSKISNPTSSGLDFSETT